MYLEDPQTLPSSFKSNTTNMKKKGLDILLFELGLSYQYYQNGTNYIMSWKISDVSPLDFTLMTQIGIN